MLGGAIAYGHPGISSERGEEGDMTEITRRDLMRLGGAGALALGASSLGIDLAWADQPAGPGPQGLGPPVRLLLNGAPGATGVFAFPAEVDTVVLDNSLVRFTFGQIGR